MGVEPLRDALVQHGKLTVELEHVAGKIGHESRCHCLTADASVLQPGGVNSRGRDLAGRSDLPDGYEATIRVRRHLPRGSLPVSETG